MKETYKFSEMGYPQPSPKVDNKYYGCSSETRW